MAKQSARRTFTISVAADVSNIEKEINTAFDKLNKQGKGAKIDLKTQKLLADFRSMLDQMQKELKSLKFDEIKTEVVDTAVIDRLKEDFVTINKEIEKININLDNLHTDPETITSMIGPLQELKKVYEEISNTFNFKQRVHRSDHLGETLGGQIQQYKRLDSIAGQYKRTIENLEKSDVKDLNIPTEQIEKSFLDLRATFMEADAQLIALEENVQNAFADTENYEKQIAALKELSQGYEKMSQTIAQLDQQSSLVLSNFKEGRTFDLASGMHKKLSEYSSDSINRIKDYSKDIKDSLSKQGISEADLNQIILTDRKLAGNIIPLDVKIPDGTEKNLKSTIDEIIKNLQEYVGSKPIMVPIEVVSHAQTNRNKEIKDGEVRLNNIYKNANKAVDIELKTNLSDISDRIKENIESWQKAFDDTNFKIAPTITLPKGWNKFVEDCKIINNNGNNSNSNEPPKNKGKKQSQSNSTSSTTNRKKKEVATTTKEETNAIKEETNAIKEETNATKKSNKAKEASVNLTKTQVSSIIKEFGKIITAVDKVNSSVQSSIQSIEKIVTCVKDLSSVLDSMPKNSLQNTLDVDWGKIQEQSKKLIDASGNIDLRGKGKKDNFQKLISSYSDYKKNKGAHSISEVIKNPKTLEKVSKYMNDVDSLEIPTSDENAKLLAASQEVKTLGSQVTVLTNSFKTMLQSQGLINEESKETDSSDSIKKLVTQMESAGKTLQEISEATTQSIKEDVTLIYDLIYDNSKQIIDCVDLISKSTIDLGLLLQRVFKFPSNQAFAEEWESIEKNYSKLVNKDGKLKDLRKKENANRYNKFVSSLSEYQAKGGLKGIEDLTNEKTAKRKLTNSLLSFQNKNITQNEKTDKSDSQNLNVVLKDLNENMKIFNQSNSSFIEALKNLTNSIDKVATIDFEALFKNLKNDNNSDSQNDFQKQSTKKKSRKKRQKETVGNDYNENFSSKEEKDQAYREKFVNYIEHQIPGVNLKKGIDLFVEEIESIDSTLNKDRQSKYHFKAAYENTEGKRVNLFGNAKGTLDNLEYTNLVTSLTEKTDFTKHQKLIAEYTKLKDVFNNLADDTVGKLDTDLSSKTDQFKNIHKNLTNEFNVLKSQADYIANKDIDLLTEDDIQDIKTCTKELTSLTSVIDKLSNDKKFDLVNASGTVIAENVRNKDLIQNKLMQTISDEGTLSKPLEFSKLGTGFTQVTSEIKTYDGAVKKLKLTWDETLGTLRLVEKSIDSSGVALKEIIPIYNKAQKQISSIDNIIDNVDLSTKTESFSLKQKELLDQLQPARDRINTIDFNNIDTDKLEEAKVDLKEINDVLEKIKALNSNPNFNMVNDQGRIVAQNVISSDQHPVRKIIEENLRNKGFQLKDDFQVKGIGKEMVEFTGVVQKQNGEVQKLKFLWDSANGTLRQTTDILQKGTTGTSAFLKGLSKIGRFIANFWTPYEVVTRTIQVVRDGLNQVKELDKAFTEMQKVSDAPTLSLEQFSKQSFNVADQIASTGLEVQQSAADWMRLGYSIQEAGELAKNSAIYSNVGDMDVQTSTEHLLSSVKAFKGEFKNEVEASTAIIDKYNKIGNEFAISSAGIGESLERSAASLVSAGNTLDQAIGLTTAGNLIQQDPETVGNALKVVSLRTRGAKTELEEMGESVDGMAESSSKLRGELLALTGIDILKDNGKKFKSTYEIFDEISQIWDKLSDLSKANVLEKLAGKTRSGIIVGLIENFQTARDVVVSAENASGSALKENENIINSIEGHTAKLKNQWQETWENAIDRDVINFVLDLNSGILELIQNIGILPSLMGTISFIGLQKGGGRGNMFPLIYTSKNMPPKSLMVTCTSYFRKVTRTLIVKEGKLAY